MALRISLTKRREMEATATNAAIGFVNGLTDEDVILSITAFDFFAEESLGSNTFGFTPAMFDIYKKRVVDELKKRQYAIKRARRTPEEILEEKTGFAIRALVRTIQESASAVDKFVTNVQEDSCYAFEWSDKAMEAAARLKVSRDILNWVAVHGLKLAVEEATRRMVDAARYPESSTSSSSNKMAQYKLAAFAEFCSSRLSI